MIAQCSSAENEMIWTVCPGLSRSREGNVVDL